MDIDYAIRKYEPLAISATNTKIEIEICDKWKMSNRLSIMFIKTHISVGIRGYIKKHEKVKELMKAINEQFVKSAKSPPSTLIIQFSTLRLTGVRGMRDHIMHMIDITVQLKSLEVAMFESFLVHYILCTLPPQYNPFKISYNTHKEKRSISELLTMCVQEEEGLLMEEGEKVHFTLPGSSKKKKAKNKGKGKLEPTSDIKEWKCFFCMKKGHIKKDCLKH